MSRAAYRRALVTGASRGIGTALARRLAADGTDLVLTARSEDALHDLAGELRETAGVAVEVLAADLTAEGGLRRIEARLETDDAAVDLLVNNAGLGHAGDFVDTDLDRLTAVAELNALAVVRLAHAAAQSMRSRGAGAIVNVSSVTAFQPGPNASVYAATKAMVLSFSEALHEELAPDGVTVLALCPGFTRTAIFDDAGADTRAVPGPLWTEPAEVADACLRALARGRAVCVPGRAYQAVATISAVTPPRLRRRIAGIVSRRF